MAENLQIFGNEYDGVNKIKVTNLEGTQVTFVKEPVLIEKNITSDGIFSAEDEGVDGYSVVNVDVTNINNVLGEKTVTKNNTTYHPFDDGLKGYSVVIVKIDDLIEKTITENGTYNASDDGVSGYSRVTVSGIGKVTGDDPDDSGDEVEASVDEQTGKVVIKKIPSSISITTKPTKLEYNEGDQIDYAGMVVKAFLKSGAVFTDETYPDGIIPDGELDKPVKTAVLDEETVPDGGYIDENGDCVFVSGGITITLIDVAPGTEAIFYYYNEQGDWWPNICIASKVQQRVAFTVSSTDGTYSQSASPLTALSYHAGYELYYGGIDLSGQDSQQMDRGWPHASAPYEVLEYYHGGVLPKIAVIPVKWMCPYGKGETFTDSFNITVNPAPDSEDDSSESHPE